MMVGVFCGKTIKREWSWKSAGGEFIAG